MEASGSLAGPAEPLEAPYIEETVWRQRWSQARQRLAALFGKTAVSLDDAAAVSEAKTRRAVRKGIGAMLFAALILALFQSASLGSYVRDLPGNALTDRLVRAADGWDMMMEALGPAELANKISDLIASVHDYGAKNE